MFDTDNGNNISPVSVKTGDCVVEPDVPEKEGFVFEGWYTDTEYSVKYDFNTPVKDNLTLYAKWKTKVEQNNEETGNGDDEQPQDSVGKYKIDFISNGGSRIKRQYVTKSDFVSEPEIPVKDCYIFKGWYIDEDLTEEFDFTTPVTESITLYACWEEKLLTISFETNDGSKIEPITFKEGDIVKTPETPIKQGYRFVNWYSDENCTKLFNFSYEIKSLTENITIYAKWQLSKYNVSFVTNDGSPVETQIVEYGNKSVRPDNPLREHYTFGGWYTTTDYDTLFNFEETPVNRDLTIYAKWNPINHVITVNSTGGSTTDNISFIEGKGVSKLDIPENPQKEGFLFVGWYLDSECTRPFDFLKDSKSLLEDITVYAKWNIVSYTVFFESNGGTSISSQKVEYAHKVIKPAAPAKPGYTFTGWYTTNALSTEFNFTNDVIKENKTLYAKWNINSYTVLFDSDGGSSVESQTVIYDTNLSELPEPVKYGYTFTGWYLDSKRFDQSTMKITDNITLTAKWRINSYIVTFMLEDSYYGNPKQILYQHTVSKPAKPIEDAKIFDDWYIGNNKYDFTTNIIEDTVITGKWLEIPADKCIVTYKSDTGVVLNQLIVNRNSLIEEPPLPVRNGHSFTGWYYGSTQWDYSTMKPNDNIVLIQHWTPNNLGIQVTIENFSGEPDIALTYNESTTSFTAAAGFTSYYWNMTGNGVQCSSTDTNTFDIYTTTLDAGYYNVFVRVMDSNGDIHSAEANFQVIK